MAWSNLSRTMGSQTINFMNGTRMSTEAIPSRGKGIGIVLGSAREPISCCKQVVTGFRD